MRPSKVGVVISQGKMQKTVKVRIQNTNWNRHVDKYLVSYRNMLVHDELNKCREGDVVRIQYVRPLSPKKSWAVAEFIKLKGTSWVKYLEEIPAQVQKEELEKLEEFNANNTAANISNSSLTSAFANLELPADTIPHLSLDKFDTKISKIENEIELRDRIDAETHRILDEEPQLTAEIAGSASNPSIKKNLVRKYVKNKIHKEE